MTNDIIELGGGIIIGFILCYLWFRNKINSNEKAGYVIPQLLDENELQHKLRECLAKEDYESATEYRDELQRRDKLKMAAK